MFCKKSESGKKRQLHRSALKSVWMKYGEKQHRRENERGSQSVHVVPAKCSAVSEVCDIVSEMPSARQGAFSATALQFTERHTLISEYLFRSLVVLMKGTRYAHRRRVLGANHLPPRLMLRVFDSM